MERIDLYRPIHKGIRHCLLATVMRVGNLDPRDEADVRDAADAVRTLLAMLAAHIMNEEVVHRALEAKRLGSSAALRHDHAEHEREMRALANAVHSLETADPQGREALAHALYLELARFAGENLVHMNVEETVVNPLLRSLFDEDEMRAIYFEILAQEPPEQLAAGVRWLIPALSHAERVAVIESARAGVPAEVMAQLVEGMRALLPERDFAKLHAALHVPQAA